MATTFDARSLFDVYPESHHFTCVGTTKQGLRCRNSFIRNACLGEASKILDDLPALASSLRHSAELLPNLRRLAYLTLCPRWHQARLPQIEPVAHRWLSMIQGIITRGPTYLPLTPLASPLPITRQIINYSTTYIPPPALLTPPTTPRPVLRQSLFGPPRTNVPSHTHPSQVESTMLPHRPTSNQLRGSNTEQTRTHRLRTGRNVNISFNVNVDSNQNIVEHGRHTHSHGHGQTSPSYTDSTTSSRSSQASTTQSISSTRSPSSENHRLIEAIQDQMVAFQAQIVALTEALQAQAQTPRTSRPSSRSTNPGSPVLSIISTFDLPFPRPPPSAHSSNPSSPSSPNRPNFLPSSPSSSTSSSNSNRPGGAAAFINTPSSSTPSSPVIISPTPFLNLSRSGAPSPSSPSASQTSNYALVRRRPINPDTTCYVCYSPIVRAADAAWCRGSCGQNICLECFVRWIEEQRRRGQREVRCGNCRAGWMF